MDNFLNLTNLTALTVNWPLPTEAPSWAGWYGDGFNETDWVAEFEEYYGETLEAAFVRRYFADVDRNSVTVYVPAGSSALYEDGDCKPWVFWNFTIVEQQP